MSDEDGRVEEEEEEEARKDPDARRQQRRVARAAQEWRRALREVVGAPRFAGQVHREYLVVREAPLWRYVERALRPFKLPGALTWRRV